MFSAIARIARRISLPKTVTHAKLWQDESTGLRFLEVEYDAHFQNKVTVHQASLLEFFEESEGRKTCVIAGKSAKMSMSIPTDGPAIKATHMLKEPTENMLRAREVFKLRQARRYVCRICNGPAKHEVTIIRFEMSDGFGTSSMGGIDYSCENLEHLKQIQEESKGIRITIRPLRELIAW
jgi:hypothetical protein